MTKAVQKLVDEEFLGITYLRISTLHKKIVSARHDFIKLGSEDKMESLLQVLEPSLAKGNRVMVFCDTLNSSRAVDRCLSENQIFTVNYHGEVPAAERVENLKKFKSEDGDCPTLVCTDLAARGLDLDVDHVIMFDFPSNAIDYLQCTGRTARMGAKGKVTSLITKKDLLLATRIEEAMKKNESLKSLTAASVRQERSQQINQKGRDSNILKSKTKQVSKLGRIVIRSSTLKPIMNKTGKRSAPCKASKPVTFSKSKRSVRNVPLSKSKKAYASGVKRDSSNGRKSNTAKPTASKLGVVGFRGRSSSGKKESSRPA